MAGDGWNRDDIPPQGGRVAIITGSNTGLGFDTAVALAAAGAKTILAIRNPEKGLAAVERIKNLVAGADVTIQQLDLGSLGSIRQAADDLLSAHEQIDLLINNAGVMIPPYGLTEDGFELQFGTNHLGHFALTGLLLDRLRVTRGSRVVTVSSLAHTMRASIRFDDLNWERNYSRSRAYSQSKLANLMFTYELQRRLEAVGAETISVAAHPGGSNTDLVRHIPAVVRPFSGLFMQSSEMGALPTLRAATDPSVEGGQYYGPGGFRQFRGEPVLVESTRQSRDADLQRRLWEVSEELTGVAFGI